MLCNNILLTAANTVLFLLKQAANKCVDHHQFTGPTNSVNTFNRIYLMSNTIELTNDQSDYESLNKSEYKSFHQIYLSLLWSLKF